MGLQNKIILEMSFNLITIQLVCLKYIPIIPHHIYALHYA